MKRVAGDGPGGVPAGDRGGVPARAARGRGRPAALG
jgi:hypothetical protein